MSRADFRPFVPAPGQSKLADVTPREHSAGRLSRERTQQMFGVWAELNAQPFKGITTDGTVRPGLFCRAPNDAPVDGMIEATTALLDILAAEQRTRMRCPITSPNWRRWQNTEILAEDFGLRLDEAPEAARDAVLAVIQASLSAQGYEAVRGVMRINRFLGDLNGAPRVLGEYAFSFTLFNEPHRREPWGWQLFGHHLSLNCIVVDRQMIISPVFLGTEPNSIDEGPFAGLSLFEDEERDGLALMRAFTPEQRARATVAHSMVDGDLPPGRRHFADGLHLGGAARDNRVIPYEGLAGSAMTTTQRRSLLDLAARFIGILPPGPFRPRMAEIEWHLDETHFCWIGGIGDVDPFYYRIQSPVVLIEFDHHAGVFLTNKQPAKFHTHTIVRTPNGNDYGFELLRQHNERSLATADEGENP